MFSFRSASRLGESRFFKNSPLLLIPHQSIRNTIASCHHKNLGALLTTIMATMAKLFGIASLATILVSAEKDSNYFPLGYSNPNVHEKMYWRDSSNVLEDLSTFSKLYVSYQNCA
jgi:hypothetical protein